MLPQPVATAEMDASLLRLRGGSHRAARFSAGSKDSRNRSTTAAKDSGASSFFLRNACHSACRERSCEHSSVKPTRNSVATPLPRRSKVALVAWVSTSMSRVSRFSCQQHRQVEIVLHPPVGHAQQRNGVQLLRDDGVNGIGWQTRCRQVVQQHRISCIDGAGAHGIADSGYTGVDRRPELRGVKAAFWIAEKPSQVRALRNRWERRDAERWERCKASLRARVDHPFRVIRR